MTYTHVVLDFDGTCTDIAPIADRYLAEFGRLFIAEAAPEAQGRWEPALDVIRKRSPKLGWTLGGTPSAPAAADPYILAGEAARHLLGSMKLARTLPGDLHARAYATAQANWRSETAEVLAALVERKLSVSFVSNSATVGISKRLDELLREAPQVRQAIRVFGDARKFNIDELPLDAAVGDELRVRFERLPAGEPGPEGRPVYLRRGFYFDALARVWNGSASHIDSTLVVGDLWELDLALPAALGCGVHLVHREPPFETYRYELESIEKLGTRGASSADLRGLLARLG